MAGTAASGPQALTSMNLLMTVTRTAPLRPPPKGAAPPRSDYDDIARDGIVVTLAIMLGRSAAGLD